MASRSELRADLVMRSGDRSVRIRADGDHVRIDLEGSLLVWRSSATGRSARSLRPLTGLHRVLQALGLTGSVRAGWSPPLRIGRGARPGWLLRPLGL